MLVRALSSMGGSEPITWNLVSKVQTNYATEGRSASIPIDLEKTYAVIGTYRYESLYYQEIHIVEKGVEVAKIDNYPLGAYTLTISINGTTMTVTPSDHRAVCAYELF